jgi:hypothetical protein
MLWRQYKFAVVFVLAVSVLLFGANAAFASHHRSDKRISYRTDLGRDLDGDRLPETATIRQSNHLYQVSIHFTTGRPKLRLATYIPEGVGGLSLQISDLNHDGSDELLVVSATSIKPIAVWVNQGKTKYKRVQSWTIGFGRYTGPKIHQAPRSNPQPEGNISIDRLPQATLAADYLPFEEARVTMTSDVVTIRVEAILGQIPSRGPPAAVRV